MPIITGDLMDTPSEANFLKVKDFIDFLQDKSGIDPVVLLGNHDMREDGFMRSMPGWAADIPVTRMFWHDESTVGISCFNSARSGDLTKGKIGTAEFDEMGTQLDKNAKKASEYTLLAALHHHPIPVEKPEWYLRSRMILAGSSHFILALMQYQESWYERLLGKNFDQTGILEDSEHFLRWCEQRKVKAVMHGHKHIPRCTKHNGLTVIGCGSTVGKVKTQIDYETFISLNIITVDTSNRKLNCRLLAERVPGGGLELTETHEIILSNSI